MGDSDKPNPMTLRKRRGASITCLATCLKHLETKVNQPTNLDLYVTKIRQPWLGVQGSSLYALVDVINDNDLLERTGNGWPWHDMTWHDDEITELAICMKKLVSLWAVTPDSNFCKVVSGCILARVWLPSLKQLGPYLEIPTFASFTSMRSSSVTKRSLTTFVTVSCLKIWMNLMSSILCKWNSKTVLANQEDLSSPSRLYPNSHRW